MASLALKKDERIGLIVAVALHATVLAVLLVRLPQHPVVTPPKRIEVTISDLYGKTSTAPNPDSKAAADRGPVLGEPAPAPRAMEAPQPSPPQQPAPKSEPKPAPKPLPQPVQRPRPEPKQPPKPKPSHRESAIDQIISKSEHSSASKASQHSAEKPKKAGSSAFDAAFKDGLPGGTSDSGKGTPASAIGPQVRSALSAAVSRQLKPNWQSPAGVDVDKLAVTVEWSLNPDGTLAGSPHIVGTVTGVTASNRPQVRLYQENAIRAVAVSAPFNLPHDYYSAWKRLRFTFDWKLNQ